MNLNLPTTVLALLQQQGGMIDPGFRGSQEQLESVCKQHNYPLHPAVLEFEATFGGLLLPDEGVSVDLEEPHWLFGAYACLRSEAHVQPRGGSKARKLVPVVYSPNDVIYYLDADGKAFAQDTIEDLSAMPYAANATALVCRILLQNAIFTRSETTHELKGLHGEAMSARLGLSLIHEASGTDFRYYGDAKGALLIVEDLKAKETRCACTTEDQLNAIREPAGASNIAPELAKEIAPYAGKSHVRIVSEKRTSIPDMFDHLPEMRELDLSSNQLQTLPDSLWRAKELTSIDLSFNPLTTLPDGLGNLKSLRSLSLRGCAFQTLPIALAGAKNLTKLLLTECVDLDVDAALQVIAKLTKLKDLSLPLSPSLTTLAPIAHLPLKSLQINGLYVKTPDRLPSGLGQLKKLTDLRIEYADEVAGLPEAQEDIQALRLLFGKRFTDDDIRKSATRQPEKRYLQAFAATL